MSHANMQMKERAARLNTLMCKDVLEEGGGVKGRGVWAHPSSYGCLDGVCWLLNTYCWFNKKTAK